MQGDFTSYRGFARYLFRSCTHETFESARYAAHGRLQQRFIQNPKGHRRAVQYILYPIIVSLRDCTRLVLHNRRADPPTQQKPNIRTVSNNRNKKLIVPFEGPNAFINSRNGIAIRPLMVSKFCKCGHTTTLSVGHLTNPTPKTNSPFSINFQNNDLLFRRIYGYKSPFRGA